MASPPALLMLSKVLRRPLLSPAVLAYAGLWLSVPMWKVSLGYWGTQCALALTMNPLAAEHGCRPCPAGLCADAGAASVAPGPPSLSAA